MSSNNIKQKARRTEDEQEEKKKKQKESEGRCMCKSTLVIVEARHQVLSPYDEYMIDVLF
jgi:hypothetical protein